MWLRRAFFGWMIPAAFALPLWLLVGWIISGAGGAALLFLFFAIPGLFVWQLILTLLVRARGTVRADRAVSWWDVAGFAVWHLLVIAVGLFSSPWWGLAFAGALAVGVGLFWLSLWELWNEARPSRIVLRSMDGTAFIPPAAPRAETRDADVIIVSESSPTSER